MYHEKLEQKYIKMPQVSFLRYTVTWSSFLMAWLKLLSDYLMSFNNVQGWVLPRKNKKPINWLQQLTWGYPKFEIPNLKDVIHTFDTWSSSSDVVRANDRSLADTMKISA